MQKILSHLEEVFSCFENFAFRAFNFRARATPMEYWLVMPLLWAVMAYALIGDVHEIYVYLLAKEIPPLNPIYYESVLIFALTFIPRLSLANRRQHDRNKSGFWVILPMLCFSTIVVMIAALLGTMMNSSLTGVSDTPDSLWAALSTLIVASQPGGAFWSEMFQIADAFYNMGSEAISALIAEIYAQNGAVDIRRTATHVVTAIEGESGHTVGLVTAVVILLVTPVVTAFLHAIFMLLPSSPHDNIYGPAKVIALNYKKKTDDKNNPMAGYAYLYEKTEEEKAHLKEIQQAEIKSLYKSRVLGQG
ncbi:MAG: DUF805 domain-containing protein [Sulfitobacter sp.]